MLISKELEILAATFIYESNLIENIDVSQEDIITQLRNDINIGHVGALLYINSLAKYRSYIRKQDICFCQELIIEEQNKFGLLEPIRKYDIGLYRNTNVGIYERIGTKIVAIRECLQPEKIEKTM